MLKKKQDLTRLEHRVCDRMDDLFKAIVATHADKFETIKNFRLLESRIENLLSLFVMQLSG